MSEIKPFTGVDNRTKLSDVLPLETPFTLNIFPSNACNFRCSYCVQSLGSKAMRDEYGLIRESMKFETIKLISDQAKEFPEKFKLVSMMGHGEPLCNPHLPEMIKLIKDSDITDRIDVITNASLLTHELSDKLIDAGLDVLRISLQGITSEAYKKSSGVDLDFESFYENIAYFYKKSAGRCKVFVKTMDVSLRNDEISKYYELFDTISDRMYIDKVKPVYDTVSYSDTQRNLKTDRYGNVHESRIVCPQPFYMLSVWPNGDVTPCDAVYKASPLGNLHTDTLMNMWKSSAHNRFCCMQLQGNRFKHTQCMRCCAPDDVAHAEDVLDTVRNELIKKYN